MAPVRRYRCNNFSHLRHFLSIGFCAKNWNDCGENLLTRDRRVPGPKRLKYFQNFRRGGLSTTTFCHESVTMFRFIRAVSSAVRASRLHREGPRFKSVTAHQVLPHAGDVVQLVRTLPCHGRGRGFESRRPRHIFRYSGFHLDSSAPPSLLGVPISRARFALLPFYWRLNSAAARVMIR